MLFPTTDFALFFAAVFLAHWILNPRPKVWKPFMIGASYVFYAWWDWRYVFLLAGLSLLAQLGALLVDRQPDGRRRMVANASGVALVLLPLAYFKYYGFFAVNTTNALASLGVSGGPPLLEVVLPVGISFFTFMAVSYVVDVFRHEAPVASWIDVFLYLSFFPHLVAGPIVRPNELIPQLDVRRDPRSIDLAGSAWLILGGLFKKVVVASYLSTQIVDPVFADPNIFGAVDVLFAILGYAVVIYSDFSGYTDIAIGVAQLLGFQFPQNFNRPYAARSIQDFWRRWHMTLSRWLRDYLYIPLGGNRRGEGRTYLNIMITMLLGGLWHGAAWHFVFWGAYHGVLLAAHHYIADLRVAIDRPPPPDTRWRIARQRTITFGLVCVGWVFFRSDSMATAFAMLGRLVTGWSTPSELVTPLVVITVAAMIALQYAPHQQALRLQDRISRMHPVALGAAMGVVLMVIAVLGPQGVAPFIYFQF